MSQELQAPRAQTLRLRLRREPGGEAAGEGGHLQLEPSAWIMQKRVAKGEGVWQRGGGGTRCGGAQGSTWGCTLWPHLLEQPLCFREGEIEGQEWLSGPPKVTRLISGTACTGEQKTQAWHCTALP